MMIAALTKAVRLKASQTSFMVVSPTVPDIREQAPQWAKPFATVPVDVLSHPPERRGKGEARSPLVCRASHGSGRLKNGRFGAQALKAVFLTAGQAKPACPLARPGDHRRAGKRTGRRAASEAATPRERERHAAITVSA